MNELQTQQIKFNPDSENKHNNHNFGHQRQQQQASSKKYTVQNIESVINLQQSNNNLQKKQIEAEPASKILHRVKSTEQLESQFNDNTKILENLNSNIDELFKKISQLTQEVQIDLKHKNSIQFEEIIDLENQKENLVYSLHEYELGTKQKDFPANPSQISLQNQLDDLDIGLSMKDFQTGKTLGYGKFGEVMECRHLKTGSFYALKKIFKSTIAQYKMEDQTIIQIQSIKRLDHPNIVKAYKSFTDPFHVFILFQYVHGTQLIKKFKSCQEQVADIIYQVLRAVEYMHQRGVVHRDLKPQNIIISEGNVIKITDFGWASLDGQQLDIMCGTIDYLSPEMAEKSVYTKEIDLWSIGILTYELLFGVTPFKGQNREETIQIIKKIDLKYPKDIIISKACKQFIDGLLKPSHSRKNIKWALEHEFVLLAKSVHQGCQDNLKEQINKIL